MLTAGNVGLCFCFALVALIGQSHANTGMHVQSSLVQQQGEAMLAQIKRSSACSFNGMDFSPLTHVNGTDYTYSTSDNHYTWYAELSSVVTLLRVSFRFRHYCYCYYCPVLLVVVQYSSAV